MKDCTVPTLQSIFGGVNNVNYPNLEELLMEICHQWLINLSDKKYHIVFCDFCTYHVFYEKSQKLFERFQIEISLQVIEIKI